MGLTKQSHDTTHSGASEGYASTGTPCYQQEPQEITPQQLQAWQDAGREVIIVDVREASEWEAGHIDGAHSIPLEVLPEEIKALDKTATLVLYSRLSHRSWQAMVYLWEAGFCDVSSLAGGLEAWQHMRFTHNV